MVRDMLPWVLRCPRDSPHLAAQKAKANSISGVPRRTRDTFVDSARALRELENTDVDAESRFVPVSITPSRSRTPTYDTAAAECLGQGFGIVQS